MLSIHVSHLVYEHKEKWGISKYSTQYKLNSYDILWLGTMNQVNE